MIQDSASYIAHSMPHEIMKTFKIQNRGEREEGYLKAFCRVDWTSQVRAAEATEYWVCKQVNLTPNISGINISLY